MELRHLRYFLATVRNGSISRAAKALCMAQPPLSRQIHQLENDLGVSLFERGSRPLRVTDAGRFVQEQAMSILDRAEALMMMAKCQNQFGNTRLGIGFVGSTLYGPLPEMIRRLRVMYPSIDVEMAELTNVQQVSALKEGRIDVGFGHLPVDDPVVYWEVLADEPLIAALPIGSPLLNQVGPVRFDELVLHRLIVYRSKPHASHADQVLSMVRKRGLKPGHVREVGELQTALGLVAAGMGVSIVPATVQCLRRHDVVYRPLEDGTATMPAIMCSRLHDTSRDVAALLQVFRDLHRRWDRGPETRDCGLNRDENLAA